MFGRIIRTKLDLVRIQAPVETSDKHSGGLNFTVEESVRVRNDNKRNLEKFVKEKVF